VCRRGICLAGTVDIQLCLEWGKRRKDRKNVSSARKEQCFLSWRTRWSWQNKRACTSSWTCPSSPGHWSHTQEPSSSHAAASVFEECARKWSLLTFSLASVVSLFFSFLVGLWLVWALVESLSLMLAGDFQLRLLLLLFYIAHNMFGQIKIEIPWYNSWHTLISRKRGGKPRMISGQFVVVSVGVHQLSVSPKHLS